ncbi:alpha/beta fold hydrolase [Aristophania vespae]|uniref:alpha/beta fold hydrolase n=1 Tax=Aristophania vespae TaxID=2697033 RepID=UPI002351A155|nr:alpha/beta hydrolase [Aristophania vespae]UMM64728.1 hypothetical protein DM15PD_17470 [Aristophania vespae]
MSYEEELCFSNPSIEVVENSLWYYADRPVADKVKDIVLLLHGKNNTGFGVWSWSYFNSMPRDGFYPVALTLPHSNTADLNISGKYVAAAIYILRRKFPAHHIHIVAHSMGNISAAWAFHYRPSFMSKHVTSFCSIGAVYAGVANLYPGKPATPADLQVIAGSNFLKEINSAPFPDPVRYLSIISETDEVTTGNALTAKEIATFPAGTKGKVVTPQEVFGLNTKISHVEEVAVSSVYEIVRAFLRNEEINLLKVKNLYYEGMEIDGLNLTLNSGDKISHHGDSPLVTQEPPLNDVVI